MGFCTLDEFFEALTLIQTLKIHPLPLVLFGTAYWHGLLQWIHDTMLKYEAISEHELNFITVTDDPQEVLATMSRHREWKERLIKEATHKSQSVFGIETP